MSFMVLLVVTLATIVQMQIRLTKQTVVDARARQLAKFAAYQALNRIQVTLGPDTRVSANASIFEDLHPEIFRMEEDAKNKYEWWQLNPRMDLATHESLSGTSISNSNWVGVWDSRPGRESKAETSFAIKPGYGEYESNSARKSYSDRLMRSSISWLVSGNPTRIIDAEKSKYEHTYLPNKDYSAMVESDEFISAVTKNAAYGTGGENTFKQERHGVFVPIVTMEDSEDATTGGKERSAFEKRIAWWVSDEGQKASINAVGSEPMYQAAQADPNNFHLQTQPYQSGVQGLTMPGGVVRVIDNAIASTAFSKEDSRATIRALDTAGDIDFIKSHQISQSSFLGKMFFHDLTANTKGVIVNVREGGLKKDLSLGLLQRNGENDKWLTVANKSVFDRTSEMPEYFPRPVGNSGYNYKNSGYSQLPSRTTPAPLNDLTYLRNEYTKLSKSGSSTLNQPRRRYFSGHIFAPQLPNKADPSNRDINKIDDWSAITQSNIERIWGDQSFHKDPGGPLWDQLRSYYNLRQENKSDAFMPRMQSDDRVGFAPVVNRFQVFFVPNFISYGGGLYGLRLHVIPVAILWNPYDVPIKGGNYYMLHIETTSDNITAFRFAIMEKKAPQYECIRDYITEELPSYGTEFGFTSQSNSDATKYRNIGYGGRAENITYIQDKGKKSIKHYPVPLFLNDVKLFCGVNYTKDFTQSGYTAIQQSPYKTGTSGVTRSLTGSGDLRFTIYAEKNIPPGEGRIYAVKGIVDYFSSLPDMSTAQAVQESYMVEVTNAEYGALYFDVPHEESLLYYAQNKRYPHDTPFVLFRDINPGTLWVDMEPISDASVNSLNTKTVSYELYTDGSARKQRAFSNNGPNFYRCNLHVWNMGKDPNYRREVWGDGIDPYFVSGSTYVRGPVMCYYKGNRDMAYTNGSGDAKNYAVPQNTTFSYPSFPNPRTYNSSGSYIGVKDPEKAPGRVFTDRENATIQNWANADEDVVNFRRHSIHKWTENEDYPPIACNIGAMAFSYGFTESKSLSKTKSSSDYSHDLYDALVRNSEYRMYGVVFMTPAALNSESQKPIFNRKFLINNAIFGMAHEFDFSPRNVNLGIRTEALPTDTERRKLYQTFGQRVKGMYGQNQAYGNENSKGSSIHAPAFYVIPSTIKPNVGMDESKGQSTEAQLMHILRDDEIVNNVASLASVHLNFSPGQVRLYAGAGNTSVMHQEFVRNYGIQTVDYITPTYPIGNSLAPLRIAPHLSYAISWTDGQAAPQDGGMYYPGEPTGAQPNWFDGKRSSLNEERSVLYDVAYHLNDSLWDEYFFSTLPYRKSEIGDIYAADVESGEQAPDGSNYVVPRNPRMTIYRDSYDKPTKNTLRDDTSNFDVNSKFGQGGFDKNAGRLMINGAFNVNSTSVTAWKTILSTFYGAKIRPYSGGGGTQHPAGSPYTRWDAPYADRYVSSDLTFYEPNLLKGYRVLADAEIEELAVAIVENIKDRGPFYSMSDFVNRVVENRTSEAIYAKNIRAQKEGTSNPNKEAFENEITVDARVDRDDKDFYTYKHIHMQKGVLQAAIDSTKINSAFYGNRARQYIISSDGSSTRFNPNITELLATNSDPARYFYYPQDTWENWRAAIGPQSVGIPEFFMQQDLLSRLGSFLTVRSDTFKIRAYGEIRNPITKEVEAKAWCEMTVQRIPDYVDSVADESWRIANREVEPGHNYNYTAFDPFSTNDGLDYYVSAGENGIDGQESGGISKVNAKLGRRFKVVAFRWLPDSEI